MVDVFDAEGFDLGRVSRDDGLELDEEEGRADVGAEGGGGRREYCLCAGQKVGGEGSVVGEVGAEEFQESVRFGCDERSDELEY